MRACVFLSSVLTLYEKFRRIYSVVLYALRAKIRFALRVSAPARYLLVLSLENLHVFHTLIAFFSGGTHI